MQDTRRARFFLSVDPENKKSSDFPLNFGLYK